MKKFLKEEPKVYLSKDNKKIKVIKYFCKGCGICINFCPKKVLDWDKDFKVFAKNPDECIACYLCELMCPDFAIFIEKEK
ncbi:MAG: ferredoxin family protein [candidate division WOR-3 bacterium]